MTLPAGQMDSGFLWTVFGHGACPREKAEIHYWKRDIAPSTELRRWYNHDDQKWPEFRSRYFTELEAKPEELKDLLRIAKDGTVTLVFSSKERRLNNAFALKEFLESTA